MKVALGREWLYQKYVVDKLSATEIANLYGTYHSKILRKLKEFNIDRRTRAEAIKIRCNKEDMKLKVSERFSKAHKGAGNPNWNGGRIVHDDGAIKIYCPEHPYANHKGYVYEHRLVMEEYLRKNEPNHQALIKINGEVYLKQGWIVHHKGIKYSIGTIENKQDNRPENLELFNSEHIKYHRRVGR